MHHLVKFQSYCQILAVLRLAATSTRTAHVIGWAKSTHFYFTMLSRQQALFYQSVNCSWCWWLMNSGGLIHCHLGKHAAQRNRGELSEVRQEKRTNHGLDRPETTNFLPPQSSGPAGILYAMSTPPLFGLLVSSCCQLPLLQNYFQPAPPSAQSPSLQDNQDFVSQAVGGMSAWVIHGFSSSGTLDGHTRLVDLLC